MVYRHLLSVPAFGIFRVLVVGFAACDNVIDAVVAGRLVNEDALSAIGVSVPIYLLFVSVILGLAIEMCIRDSISALWHRSIKRRQRQRKKRL